MANLATFGDLKTRLGKLLNMSQSDQQTLLGEFINEAGAHAYHAHAWPRRRMYGVLELEPSTVVDADTGGLAGSVGSDILTTIDAQDFTGFDGYKIARGGIPSDEWFWINADHVSTTNGAAKVNYKPRETFDSEAYAIYKDEYALPTTVHSVLADDVVLMGPDGEPLYQIPEFEAPALWPSPTGYGVPRRFAITSYDPAASAQDENATIGTAEAIRLRFGPLVPGSGERYRIRYAYLRRWTILTDDADVPVFDYDLRPLIIEGALALAYAYLDEFRDSRMVERQEARYRRALKEKARNVGPIRPRVAVVRPFDRPSVQSGLRYTLPPES